MANLIVNGRNVGGEIYQLKPGKKLADAIETAKHDGVEEVFFRAHDKDYVAVGPSLMLDADMEHAIKHQARLGTDSDLSVKGVLTPVKLIDCDRENQGAFLGLAEATRDWKRSGLSRVALGAFATAGGAWGATASAKLVASGISQLGSKTALGVAAGLGKSAGGAIGAVTLGLVAIGGVALAVNGARQIPRANEFQAQEQARLDRKVSESPIQEFLGERVK